MITAIQYARYSSTNQRDESIEAQFEDMDKYAEKNGIVIIKKYSDEAESAKTDNRPEFQNMMRDVKDKIIKPQLLLVHKVDRFARNRTDAAFHKHALKKAGIKIIYVNQNIPDSPEGKLLEGMMESVAEYYSENLANEVMKGLRMNAKKCLHTGGLPPLGYDVKDQKYYINEHEAIAVKKIFEMYVDGAGYSAIIDWLNMYGFKTKFGQPFGKNSLYAILSNEKYIGTYVFNRASGTGNRHKNKADEDIIKVPGGIPRIIDDKLWMEAKDRMETKKFKNGTNKAKHEYLLTGLIHCSCGSKMTGNTRKSKKGSEKIYSDYQCIARKQTRTCDIKGVNRELLEDRIISLLQENLFSEKNVDAIAQKVYDHFQKGYLGNNMDIYNTKQTIVGIERKLQKMVDAICEGLYNPTMKEAMTKLEEQKNNLEIELSRHEKKMAGRRASMEDVKNYLLHFAKLDKFTFEDKKKAIQQFINKIVVSPDSIEIHSIVNIIGRGEPFSIVFTLLRPELFLNIYSKR